LLPFPLIVQLYGCAGKPYCKPHFKQLFQLKGNYAGGFGELTPEQSWKGKGDGPDGLATIPGPASAPAPAARDSGKAKVASTSSVTMSTPVSTPAAAVRAAAAELAAQPPPKIYDDTVLHLAREYPGAWPESQLFKKSSENLGGGMLGCRQYFLSMIVASGSVYERVQETSLDKRADGRMGQQHKEEGARITLDGH
jgi:hypothetical protein